jgi:hypothetical protein
MEFYRMTTLTNDAPNIVQNTRIWDAVCETDPKYTKKVNQRGGFTAIDAMSQIHMATKQFGPIGIGWGYDVELIFPANNTIIAKVTLWHGDRSNTVVQCGQKSLGTSRVDEDAAKKAVTDSVTKCLSLLGFNADVFLGKFDDSKYVEERIAETQAPPARTSADIPFDEAAVSSEDRTWHLWVEDQIAGFKDYTSMDDLRFWHETQKPNLTQLKAENAELHQKLSATLKLAKEELSK